MNSKKGNFFETRVIKATWSVVEAAAAGIGIEHFGVCFRQACVVQDHKLTLEGFVAARS